MNALKRFQFFLWTFGHFRVPLIGHLKPKLIELDDEHLVVRIRLNRRSKNHLHSMYFGALSVGADLAGGLHGFYHAKALNLPVSLAFKSFQAQFLKRAESDVYFICREGQAIKKMIETSRQNGLRINQPIPVQAYTHYPENPEQVAEFILELSLKVTT